jgi:hypothetical protein
MELGMTREITISLNKEVAAGHLLALECGVSMFFLAGRGGEEEEQWGVTVSGASAPLAGRGGEERRRSPWVTLAFADGLWSPGEILSNKWILLQANLFRLPPPFCGRNGESDGGLLCIDGVGEGFTVARCFSHSSPIPLFCAVVVMGGGIDWVRESTCQQWSWEAIFLSSISAADGSRPTSKAKPWPIQKPAKDSGVSTSFARPLPRSAAAYYGCVEASGPVPASSHDGGVADLWLGGGEREGPDCVSSSLSEVFSVNAGDLYVLFNLMGSSVIICTSTVWI